MGLREKRIFLGTLALLVFVAALYLYQSFSVPEVEVYGVSVVLCSGGENFEKGLTGAALEKNADLHIVRVTDPSANAQTAALERELQNGANAVILYRADAENLSAWLLKNKSSAPLVLAGDALLSGKGASHVSLGAKALSAALVTEMEKQPLRSVTVAEDEGGERLTEFLAALDAAGFTYDLVHAKDVSHIAPGKVYASCDPAATLLLAEAADKGAFLYGMGYDAALRNLLESGKITALAIASEFDAGYLAVTEAVSRIDGGRTYDAVLSAFIARSDNMYEPPISAILFPIG
ncbi:MAG TPA: hypothetical protein VN512_08375 [Clostridia bacterium]|nr:hypothetical protein [Clostridia bacterium]